MISTLTFKNTAVVSGTFSFVGTSIESANWLPNFFMPKGKFEDLTGRRFTRLLVIRRADYRDKFNNVMWVCICDCGKEVITAGNRLKEGKCKSCHCYSDDGLRESIRKKRKGLDIPFTTIPEYGVWKSMIERCKNPNRKEYPNYGGRGISVCKEWVESFPSFLKDMGSRPTPKHTLDRINNEGNYDPSNCKWSTRREQLLNRRNNRILEYNGVSKTITEWGEEYNLDNDTIGGRIKRGWPIEEAITARPYSIRHKQKNSKRA